MVLLVPKRSPQSSCCAFPERGRVLDIYGHRISDVKRMAQGVGSTCNRKDLITLIRNNIYIYIYI